MNRRTLLPAICAGMALSLATGGWAQTPNRPPDDFGDNPPVRQNIGMMDTVMALQEAADCRVCHTNTVNLHHMQIQDGAVCLDCHAQGGQGGFVVERNCVVCHTTSPHHRSDDAIARHCTECHGNVVADFDDGHYIPTYAASLVTPKRSLTDEGWWDDGTHVLRNTGAGVLGIPVGTYTGTAAGSGLLLVSPGQNNDFYVDRPERTSSLAIAVVVTHNAPGNPTATCTWAAGAGAGTLTIGFESGVTTAAAMVSAINAVSSPNPPGSTTNRLNAALANTQGEGTLEDPTLYSPIGGLPLNSRGFGAGGCNYCHDDDGATNASGVVTPVLIYNNHDTHHNLNWPDQLSNGAGATWRRCNVCHDYVDRNPHLDPSRPTVATYAEPGGPGFALAIRICEECHSPESLHRIQADSDANGIVVGGELMGYGHVGKDGAPGSSDCWGCHGFDFNAGSVPFAGPTIPTLYNTDISTVRAGQDTTVILAGASFTNTTGGQSYEADVRLTDGNGVTVILQPELVLGDGSLAVKIPGRTRPGNYRIQAVKGDVASNPVSISVTPVPRISRATYQGTVTIVGSGFGGYADGSPTAVTATVTSGVGRRATTKTVTGTIVSWTDSKIVVNFGAAPRDVTVTSVFGTVKAAVASK